MKERSRRMIKTLSLLLCALLLALSLSACQFPGYQVDTGVSNEDRYPVEKDEEPKKSAENPHMIATDDVYADLQSTSIDEVKFYYLGEPALLSPTGYGDKIISMIITGAEMSKTTCGYDLGDRIPDSVGFDGTKIMGDYSFVFVNVEMTNLSEESQVVCSSLRYYYVGDDGFFKGQGGGAIFFDQAEDTTQDYWYTLLQPEETLTAVVGLYVIGGLDLTQGFIPVDFSGVPPNSETEWFALTERE